MKINICYFTSTGNTLWLAQKTQNYFENEGHVVKLFEIVKDDGKFLFDCDLTGIFYPVWGSTLPDPFRDFIAGLEEDSREGKKMFLVGNCAIFTGDTGMYWKRILESKGFNVFFVDHLVMPMNVNVPQFNFWKVPDEEKKKKILNRAQKKLERICTEILSHRKRIDGISPLGMLGGWGQRTFYDDALRVWKGMFSIDRERCTSCRLCFRMCPVENIQMSADGLPAFADRCIFCMKCYNLCPVNAVLIGKKSADDEKYRRYKGPSRDIKPVIYR